MVFLSKIKQLKGYKWNEKIAEVIIKWNCIIGNVGFPRAGYYDWIIAFIFILGIQSHYELIVCTIKVAKMNQFKFH